MLLVLQTYVERQLSVPAWPGAQAAPTSRAEALWLQEGPAGVIPVGGLARAPQSRAVQPIPANKYEQK